MAAITAQMVKVLRDKTGAGMMDCKRALTEADGDTQKAIDLLRKSGIAKAAKKADRVTNEGCVVSLIEGGTAVLAEILCETDFVSRNATFREFVEGVVARALANSDTDGDITDAVREAEKGAVGELVGSIGENIQIRRVTRWTTDGQLGSYIHMGGKIGVLTDIGGPADSELINDVCMHVAAFSPRYVDESEVPGDLLAKEKEIAAAQVAGKPAAILDKIVMGKISKWHSEVCLSRQPWLRDDKKCLAKVAPQVTVKRFLRWQMGEEL